VLATEHLFGLAGIHLTGEIVQRAPEIVGDRLPRFGPFHQHREIVGPAAQRVAEVPILLEPPAALQQLLRFCLIFPEVGGGDARF
jgi:hypothetical protein